MKQITFVFVLVALSMALFGCTLTGNGSLDDTNNIVVQPDDTNYSGNNGGGIIIPPAITFELKSWDMNVITSPDDKTRRILAFEFYYSTNMTEDEFYVSLTQPNGKVIYEFIKPTGYGWIQVAYSLKGDYQFQVLGPPGSSSEDTVLFDRNFSFEGPEVSIIDASIDGWKENHSLGYEPTSIAIEVENTGDLAFPAYYRIVIDGDMQNPSLPLALGDPAEIVSGTEEDWGYWEYGWINPGKWTYHVPFEWALQKGSHTADIWLVDWYTEKGLQKFSITVDTP
ncbi:MAG: hypothetical protein AABW59_04005 [archaeon]